MNRYPNTTKILCIAAATLLFSNISLAINPDGSKGGRAQTASSPTPTVAGSKAKKRKGGIPILENPSADDIRAALGIGQEGVRDIAALETAGFGSFIEFESNSARVIPSGGLDVILQALLDLEENASVLIVGHTDSDGGYAHNMDLSQRRAEAVRRWLEANGVRRGAIRTKGAGETQPIDDNGTAEGRRRNRRVEFTRIHQ